MTVDQQPPEDREEPRDVAARRSITFDSGQDRTRTKMSWTAASRRRRYADRTGPDAGTRTNRAHLVAAPSARCV